MFRSLIDTIKKEQPASGFTREARIERTLKDERTVELAFSSEVPVTRWFGDEVLVHEKGAMRLDRMSSGAAVLVNHDVDDQIGVVVSARVDADNVGRAVVRFGRSARANEIWEDVQDGIRSHVSVGYAIHAVETEEREGMPDLVRVTDWEPFEISIVSVPADPSVGVGRSSEKKVAPTIKTCDSEVKSDDFRQSGEKDRKMETKILRDASGNLVRAKVDGQGVIVEVLEVIEKAGADVTAAREAGSSEEKSRVRDLIEMGRKFNNADMAQNFIQEGKTADQMRDALLESFNKRTQTPLSDQDSGDIGLTNKECRQFSFLRAINALANPTSRSAQEAAAFEFEVSLAAAQRANKKPEGILIPTDILRRALNTSTSEVAAGDSGGNVIDNVLMAGSFIDILRNKSILMNLATSMSGLVGDVSIPKQTAAATGSWIGEDGDAPESVLELGQINMTPKTVAALSEITRKLMQQDSVDVENLVRRDLATALALTIDLAGFYGTGSANQPLGIKNTSGINAVVFATANPTYLEVIDMESQIAADNADVNSMAYVLNSNMRGYLKGTEKFTGTSGNTIWEQGNTVNGYNAQVTNQITAGDVFFGNFADLLVGMWGGLDLTVDPYTHSAKGRLRIVAMQDVDFALRRVESFCYGNDGV